MIFFTSDLYLGQAEAAPPTSKGTAAPFPAAAVTSPPTVEHRPGPYGRSKPFVSLRPFRRQEGMSGGHVVHFTL